MEKKLINLKLVGWFENKQDTPFIHASANASYNYKVSKETEKAIQIHIFKKGKEDESMWYMWMPKSVVLNLNEVLS